MQQRWLTSGFIELPRLGRIAIMSHINRELLYLQGLGKKLGRLLHNRLGMVHNHDY